MRPNPFKPHRQARGYGIVVQDGTHFPRISLYNNSALGQYLAVLNFLGFMSGGTNDQVSYAAQGKIGTLAMHGASVFVNSGQLPGDIYTDNTSTTSGTSVAAADFLIFSGTSPSWAWAMQTPFAVIPPGYSLVAHADAANLNYVFSFFWQVWEIYEYQQIYGDRADI